MKDPRRPMPHGLRQRLRDIPQREVLCRDVDRLYRLARTRARATPKDSDSKTHDDAAEHHLAECTRCRELYATLTSALAVRRLSLPGRLAHNLRQVARHPDRLLPIWIADTRYAAAACYLLAALTLSLAGDASALFRTTTQTVGSTAVGWVDKRETQGVQAWQATTTTVRREIDNSWKKVSQYRTSTEEFLVEVYQTLENKTLEMIPGNPGEGDDHGKSGNEKERRAGNGAE